MFDCVIKRHQTSRLTGDGDGCVAEVVRDRVLVHYQDLVQLINSHDGLLEDLLAIHCISSSHSEYIKSANSYKQRNDRMLKVMCRRSKPDFKAFLSCLGRKQSAIVALFQQLAGNLISPEA